MSWWKDYEDLGALGEGSFAVVHRARHRLSGALVAIKELKPAALSDLSLARQLLDEARTDALLSHDGIVRLLEVREDCGRYAIVMELMEGGTLARRLGNGPLSGRETASLGGQVARALSYAHAHGVFHRDVKPANLFLTADGRVKIGDFGLAVLRPVEAVVAADGAGSAPQDSTLTGTIAYMAPERFAGYAADARTDLFALCVVLFECVTGRLPFRGATFSEVTEAIQICAPDWAEARAAGLDPGLEAILARGLARDPRRRYPGMAQLAADLEVLGAEQRPLRVAPLPDIVGRRTELDRLDAVWERMLGPAGRGRVVLVSGEAGIGKTTLVEQWRRRLAARTSLVAAAATFRDGRGGFGPIGRALGTLAGAAGETALAAQLREAEASPAGAWEQSGFSHRIEQVLTRIGRDRPFLWVLENLHEADADALQALAGALPVLADVRGIVVLTCRRDARSSSGGALHRFVLGLTAEGLADEIALERFDADDTRELIARSLGAGAVVADAAVDLVQRETEGNPLFVVETTRLLLDRGELAASGRMTGRPSLPLLPRRVQDVLLRLLEPLSAPAHRLLEAGAVAGEGFPAAIAASAAELDGVLTEKCLAELVDGRLLVAGAGEYRFRHAKIREVVLGRMLPERRARLHGLIADALARAGDADAEDLAVNLLAAGRPGDALPHLLAAARSASAHAASQRARELYGKAREILARRPGQAALHAEVTLELAQLERLAGHGEVARGLLVEVAAGAAASDDVRAMAIHHLGWMELRDGEAVRARRRLRRARELFQRAGNRVWAAACRDALGHAWLRSGNLARAMQETRGALAERRALAFAWGVAISQANLGVIHRTLGRPDRAIAAFEASRDFFRAERAGLEARRKLALVVSNLAVLALEQGQVERALAAAQEALAIRREIGDRRGEIASTVILADARRLAGFGTLAAESYAYAVSLAREARAHDLLADALCGLGELRLGRGQRDLARPLLEEGLETARAAHAGEAECRAQLALAELARSRLARSEARSRVEAAAAAAARHRLDGFAARIAGLEAALAEEGGDRAAARTALRRALRATRRRPEPELEWRLLLRLAALLERNGADRAGATRLRARARRRLRSLLDCITQPLLRRAFAGDPERAALLGEAVATTGASGTA